MSKIPYEVFLDLDYGEKYFTLDPFYNYYYNNLFVNRLRVELMNCKSQGLSGGISDYGKIAKCLEQRFEGSDIVALEREFMVDRRLLEHKLIYDCKHFSERYLFVVERYGKYVCEQLNKLLGLYGVSVEYSKDYEAWLVGYVKVCNFMLNEKEDKAMTMCLLQYQDGMKLLLKNVGFLIGDDYQGKSYKVVVKVLEKIDVVKLT